MSPWNMGSIASACLVCFDIKQISTVTMLSGYDAVAYLFAFEVCGPASPLTHQDYTAKEVHEFNLLKPRAFCPS